MPCAGEYKESTCPNCPYKDGCRHYKKQLTKEANERILKSQAKQSKLVAKAQGYFAR